MTALERLFSASCMHMRTNRITKVASNIMMITSSSPMTILITVVVLTPVVPSGGRLESGVGVIVGEQQVSQ